MLSGLGPDWKWGNQDGGAGNVGRVYAVNSGVVEVLSCYYPSVFLAVWSAIMFLGIGVGGGGGDKYNNNLLGIIVLFTQKSRHVCCCCYCSVPTTASVPNFLFIAASENCISAALSRKITVFCTRTLFCYSCFAF